MAFRNDGGNFSDDPITRLLAQKAGSMNAQDLAQQEQVPQDSAKLASGVMGSVAPISKFPGISGAGEQMAAQAAPEAINVAEQTIPSMADKIRAAAAKSSVNTPKDFVVHNNPLTQVERTAKFGAVESPTNDASMYQQGTPSGDAIKNYWSNIIKSMRK